MPVNDERHPFVLGTDNGEAVLVRAVAHDHGRTNLRVGDEAWVAGDGVEAFIAECYAVEVGGHALDTMPEGADPFDHCGNRELRKMAQYLEVPGRSSMNTDQLREAVRTDPRAGEALELVRTGVV